MGPIILLDKSALESLHYDEIGFLGKHYYMVIPPVLIYEILGDLSKYEGKEDKFSKIASKLSSTDSRINLNQRFLCLLSLLGHYIPMKGQPIIEPGVELTTSTGEKGRFADEPVERKLVRKWQQGKHTLVERAISQGWRKITKSFDMENYRKKFMDANRDIPKANSLQEMYLNIYKLIMDINNQDFYLNLLVNEYNLTPRQKSTIYVRWTNRKNTFLCDFAPYAFYCLQVFLVFHFGLANNLITTRRTNPIDLEYLYYLPFCMVFCSGDNFQKDLSKLFLNDKQDFISASILKTDLGRIKDEFYGLSKEEKEKRFYDFGPYPPLNPQSITYRLWQKHIGLWESGKYGNIKMSKEGEKRLFEKLQPMFDAIKRHDEEKAKQDEIN